MKRIEIDKVALQNIFGGAPDIQTEVFSEFLKLHGEMRRSLIDSFDSGRMEELKKTLHFHAPSFIYVGMPAITDICRALERQCDEKRDMAALSGDFSNLVCMIDDSRMLAQEELNKLRSFRGGN